MRWFSPVALAVAVLAGVTVAPADDPDVPEKYIKVDEVKTRLDQKTPLTFIDVRPREQYDQSHIRGAVSIPLRELPNRLAEVPRSRAVVLY